MGAIELIEVIIGLVFVILLLSIIVTLVNEIIITNIRLRSKLLKSAISRLLDDVNSNKVLSSNFYAHPLISKLVKGDKHVPSYISPATFSKVLMDILQNNNKENLPIPDAIKALPENSDTQVALRTLFNDADNDIEKFKLNIEEWFNESMSRLSGSYKRNTQFQLFFIGLIAAIVLNINVIHIAKELSDNKEKRIEIIEAAREYTRSREYDLINEEQLIKGEIEKETVKQRELPNYTPDKNKLSELNKMVAKEEAEIKELKDSLRVYESRISSIKGEFNAYSGLVGIFWEGKVKGPIDLVKAIKRQPLSAYIGWLIAAIATSLGSAFWFDLLKKLVNVRGTVKPESTK